MNLSVTVVTGTSHDLVTVRPGGQSMSKAVALRAEAWARNLQHELVDRTVGVVTIQAVLANQGMLEQERPALLGVTLVASVIDRSCS